MSPTNAAFVIWISTFFFICALGNLFYAALYSRLRKHHAQVWSELGSPSIWNQWAYRTRPRISRFLWKREYQDLDDPRLHSIVRYIKLAIAAVILVILIGFALPWVVPETLPASSLVSDIPEPEATGPRLAALWGVVGVLAALILLGQALLYWRLSRRKPDVWKSLGSPSIETHGLVRTQRQVSRVLWSSDHGFVQGSDLRFLVRCTRALAVLFLVVFVLGTVGEVILYVIGP